MKRLLLALSLIIVPLISKAESHRFPLDTLLSELYLRIDNSDIPRIYLQQLAQEYLDWSETALSQSTTERELMYLNRVSGMFNEVMITYQYGFGCPVNNEEIDRLNPENNN